MGHVDAQKSFVIVAPFMTCQHVLTNNAIMKLIFYIFAIYFVNKMCTPEGMVMYQNFMIFYYYYAA